LLGPKEILTIVPHRYPFLFIDGILKQKEDEIWGYKNVCHNDPYLYRFPNELPRLPETIIMECMSQVGVVGILSQPHASGKIMLFAAAENLNFFRPVYAGNRLVTRIQRVYLKGNLGKMKASSWVDDEPVAEGYFSFALVDSVSSQ
jgi:3-hydroxyacyl-[acyl-carrier-protein] dehydratase